MSQSDRFGRMLRDVVAPRLRAAGFRGSGQRYELPDADEWRLATIQRSRWNDPSTVEFTVNLFRCSRRDWEDQRQRSSWLPARPTGNVAGDGRFLRLGHLLPGGGDRWWRIEARVDADGIGREVAEAIVTVGRAWLVGTGRHPAEH